MTYPIKFKVSRKLIEELYLCEQGRFQDAQHAREQNDHELIRTNRYEVVFCDFANRHLTQIEVRNDAELFELEYVLRTGTIDIHMPVASKNLLGKVKPLALERVKIQAK